MARGKSRRQKANQPARTGSGVQQSQQKPTAAPGTPPPARLLQVLEEFSGPIPPPSLLREYDQLIDGGAERIFGAFEAQTKHRQTIESQVITGNEKRATRGQVMAYSLALLILALGSVMIFNGHGWEGTTLISIDLVGLVSVFVTSKLSQQQERAQKFQLQRRK